MALKIFLIVLVTWLLVGSAGLLAAHLSGYIRRGYRVSHSETIIEIAGEQKSALAWSEVYRPVLVRRSIDASPPLLNTLVEVVEQQDRVFFVYYQVWEDEIHPNLTYHKIYRLYRAAYYGTPVSDIEYFEVQVNRQTGEIDQIMFETSPGRDYNVTFSEHLTTRVTRSGPDSFSMIITKKNGDFVSEQPNVPVVMEQQRAVVGPITWNHLTSLVAPGDASFDTPVNAPLAYLTDEVYAAGKYARKSHGTFKTEEGGFGAAARIIVLAAFVVPLALVLRLSEWVKGKADGQRKTARSE